MTEKVNSPLDSALSIGAVERETGLSKDVLRKWETRYGFPVPLRDSLGERAYPPDQVNRLRLIKRLMDAGMRPSRLVGESDENLNVLAQLSQGKAASQDHTVIAKMALDMLARQDPVALRQYFHRELLRQGIELFLLDTLAPLNEAVGEAWARGDLSIHGEHLYTEVVQWLLRNSIASLSDAQGSPRILLTTLPEEQHGLGLLMAAALLSLHGAHCISLGTQTPVQEIARAAQTYSVDVIALSFSVTYPQRRIQPAVTELRTQLDEMVEIWAGGAGVIRLSAQESRSRFLPALSLALEALNDWRTRNG